MERETPYREPVVRDFGDLRDLTQAVAEGESAGESVELSALDVERLLSMGEAAASR